MTGAERGFLLLCSHLGDPKRKCLSAVQFQKLSQRMKFFPEPTETRDLSTHDLMDLGYSPETAAQMIHLLSQEDLLDDYLRRGKAAGCFPLTRISPDYPRILPQRMGEAAPAVLWYKGNVGLLRQNAVGLVGSRDLMPENETFARQAGIQAARQGYVLVSGNARGTDRTGQDACLAYGGKVISVVADSLTGHYRRGILYLSEDSFDLPFSSQRALSRNCVIHSLGAFTLVAQSSLNHGGTWDGSVKNLRYGWTKLHCFNDGSKSIRALEQMGANLIGIADLADFPRLSRIQT